MTDNSAAQQDGGSRGVVNATCPHCKMRHPVRTASAHSVLGFVDCPVSGHAYLASVNGLTLPGPLDHEART